MKKFQKLMIFVFIIGCFLINNVKVKALNTIIEDTADNIFNRIPASYDDIDYIPSASSAPDYLGYFTGNRDGWEPRIKYIGTDRDHVQMYIFCLSFHKLAPNSTSYTLDSEHFNQSSIDDKYYAYAYILKHGFGYRSYSSSTYSDLLWDYYITSMAIYQYQYETDEAEKALMTAKNYVDIRSFEGDAVTKKAILDLVDEAKKPENLNKNEFVVPYKPSSGEYQEIMANVIYRIRTPEPEPQPEPEKHYCQYVDGKYYDANGNVVNASEYNASCNPQPEPEPEKLYCEYKDGKYYDANGKRVSEVAFKKSCEEEIVPKINIVYKDKCTLEHVPGAKMKLVRGNTCSAGAYKTWTSGKPQTFNDILAGNYMICDMTNKYSMSINVKKTNETQTFEMYTNPDTCDEPLPEPEKDEPLPPTGVASLAAVGGSLACCFGGYVVLKKKNKFIKIK